MKIKINNPFIKDKKNIDWLENNWETFLDYMSKNHTLADCWHTVLDLSTFNDTYISTIIKKVEARDKSKIREEKARQKALAATPEKIESSSKIDKKNNVVSDAVEAAEKKKKEYYDLLD